MAQYEHVPCHVVDARYLGDYKVWLEFNDGRKGEIDHAFSSIVEFQPNLVVTEIPRIHHMTGHMLVLGHLPGPPGWLLERLLRALPPTTPSRHDARRFQATSSCLGRAGYCCAAACELSCLLA